jgi:5-methylcytosine-specific restriction endonuclease McrA
MKRWQVSWKMRRKVFEKTGGNCFYCGKKLDYDISEVEELSRSGFHVDHVIPLSRGGTYEIDNLVPSCFRCNKEKGDKTPEEWMS